MICSMSWKRAIRLYIFYHKPDAKIAPGFFYLKKTAKKAEMRPGWDYGAL